MLNNKGVERIENLNLIDTPCVEADGDRWLFCYLPAALDKRSQPKTFATYHNGIYLCTNSTRFAYRKICFRVIFIRHSPNNDNTPSMPLDEAHLEGFLFCTLWINKCKQKKYLLASGLDVAMVAVE